MSKVVTERGLWRHRAPGSAPTPLPTEPGLSECPAWVSADSFLPAGASSQMGCESGLWHLWGDHDGEVAGVQKIQQHEG